MLPFQLIVGCFRRETHLKNDFVAYFEMSLKMALKEEKILKSLIFKDGSQVVIQDKKRLTAVKVQ